MHSVQFHHHEVEFEIPSPKKIIAWIQDAAKVENCKINELQYILVSDDYLLQLNKDYLNHDTYTDIITFDYSNTNHDIEGEIYISIDRVKENALEYKVASEFEFSRVVIHGLLHLIGYDDKTPKQKEVMRQKENHYISLLKF